MDDFKKAQMKEVGPGGLIMTAEEYHFYFQINDYYDNYYGD